MMISRILLLAKVELQIIAHAGNDLPVCCPGILARDIQNFITANASF
ncbi:hypothetical protein PN490_18915 [Nodularia spumigena CS-588/01]|nr:hypothetical protein [Nodularia spumigena CS-588/01]